MEYDSYRQVAWHWTFLFTVFSVTVVALVLWSNPYLYDQLEFKTALARRKSETAQSVPSTERQIRTVDRGDRDGEWYGGMTHDGVEATGKGWPHSFFDLRRDSLSLKESDLQHPLLLGTELYDVRDLSLRQYGEKGQKKWEFSFYSLGEGPLATKLLGPTFDQAATYVGLSDGRLVALVRTTGDLIWINDLGSRIYGGPFVHGDKIFVFVAGLEPVRAKVKEGRPRKGEKEKEVLLKKGLQLMSVRRAHGEIDKLYPVAADLEEQDMGVSLDDTGETLLIHQGQKLLAYELATMKLLWQSTLPGTPVGPAMVDGDIAFVATKEGHLLSYSTTRGRKNWETDMETPIVSGPVLVPSYGALAVISETGTLSILDAKTGDRRWRFQLEAMPKIPWQFAARLSGSAINETKMKRSHEGWVVFAPCLRTRVCIFNPDNGQIVGRITLHGQPLMRPAVESGRILSFLTSGTEGDLRIELEGDRSMLHRLGHESNDESF